MREIIDIFFGTILIGLTLCCVVCLVGMFIALSKPIIKQFKKK